MRRLSIDLFIKMQRKRKMIECKKGLARQKEKQKHKEIIKSFDTMMRPIKGKIFTWTNYYNNSKLVNV